jgi:hypothetical protein
MKYPLKIFIIFLTLTATLLGCGNLNSPSPPPAATPETQQSFSRHGMYDSIDTAIVESVDIANRNITLINTTIDQSYTLEYSGTTTITDKYGLAMAMTQINMGDIVDVYFLKSTRMLINMQLSPSAFSYENITNYSLNGERKIASIGGANYRLIDSTLVLSDGCKIDVADVISNNIVTIRGIERDILSVVVEKGHGYLRIMNDAYAIGGWIEVGQTIIQRITDGMLLTVPEGTFDVFISARGFSATRRVTIERNKETIIDLGDVEVEEVRKGKVVFNITPATATVYIDGIETDISKVVELEFGIHQIVCEAPGYDTITQYIKVSQDIASITIAMDVAGTNTNDGSSVSDNELSVGRGRVYVDAPIGVEIYQNGVYMGISPVQFDKRPGSHTITLRREGYVTKSYTIYLEDDSNDVTYSFSVLERVTESSNNSHNNGNNDNGDNSDDEGNNANNDDSENNSDD